MTRDHEGVAGGILDQMAGIEITDEDTRALEDFFSRRYSDPNVITAKLKYQVIHDFITAMAEQNISKTKLAKLIRRSRQYVGRVLEEKSNFTLKSIATFACALNLEVSIRAIPRVENHVSGNKLEVEYRTPERPCGGYSFPGMHKQFSTELEVAK